MCDEGSPLRDVPGIDAHGTVEFLADVLRAAPGDTRPWFVFVSARCEELRSTLTHWTRPARSGRTGLLIQPDLQLDADIFTTRLPRQLASALRPGRGFIVTGGELDLAQLARA